MARARISGFEDVDKFLDALGNDKKLGIKAVKAAAPHLVSGASKAVRSSANRGYASGGLARSFAATKPKTNQYGSYLIVRPVGKDPEGHDYYARGAYLEFGTTLNGKPKNAAQPWRDKAINLGREKCEEAMEEAVLSEIDKL